MKATDQVTSTGINRIILCAICIVRSPRRLACHGQGILRELRLSLPHPARPCLAHHGRAARCVLMALMLLSGPVLCKSQSTTTNLLAKSAPGLRLAHGQATRTNAVSGGTTFTNHIPETGAETNASRMAPSQPVDASSSEVPPPLPPTGLRIIAVKQP
ncbi:MAG TPA: hypothetical protein PLC99_14915 [Verrucomicrobiota bacterium]|nr:hypothetical protein [Verrucomicrobiota bacterium]